MQEEQQRPRPPAYVQHEPASLQLPSVPTHAPHGQGSGRLPGIKALDLPDGSARHSPPADTGSPMDTASVLSAQDDAAPRRETSVSMDDPDVRLAAEALSGLGNPGA